MVEPHLMGHCACFDGEHSHLGQDSNSGQVDKYCPQICQCEPFGTPCYESFAWYTTLLYL